MTGWIYIHSNLYDMISMHAGFGGDYGKIAFPYHA